MRFASFLFLLWVIPLHAGELTGPDRDANGNIVPTPKGEACVEPAEVMRREHMNLLLHKRDQTMYDGIRTKRASLNECIDCHVTPDANGKTARADDETFFCSSCHIAASVSIDCFDCHGDRPLDMIKNSGLQK
ncbi:MAG: Hdr-like menaquinol oxidoreductase cytochrome c subunit [Gammaproteobacteria bacterium]|nr:Hdr-like menaquinol oxidoreductase cytochrome c subunit [Gammaproteobacteria bacterium]